MRDIVKIVFMPIAAGFAALSLVACSTVPNSPMEVRLNRAAGAELAAQQCAARGGYASVKDMRHDAEVNMQKAKKLGATDADIAEARKRVSGRFAFAGMMVGMGAACNQMISNLAWNGTEEPKKF